jgi:hypothetical protein
MMRAGASILKEEKFPTKEFILYEKEKSKN